MVLGGSFTFRHTIHRQVFHDRQGPLRRALSHEKIALQLQSIYADRLGEIAPKIEEHFTGAGAWTQAIAYNRLSLMSARQRFAYQDALAIFARSKRLIEHLPAVDRARVEIEFLEMEAATSAALHDPRAREVYREMVRAAAAAALVDVHARALLGLAYTASWHDSKLNVEILDEALALSARQTDSQLQARTRIGSYVWRIWARGWDEADMQLCEKAVATLNAGESALAAAWPMLEYAQLQFVSSRYREARSMIENNFLVLYSAVDMHPELNMARAMWLYLQHFSVHFDHARRVRHGDPAIRFRHRDVCEERQRLWISNAAAFPSLVPAAGLRLRTRTGGVAATFAELGAPGGAAAAIAAHWGGASGIGRNGAAITWSRARFARTNAAGRRSLGRPKRVCA